MVAPPVHVHVLVVQIAFLLFAVVARVVPPVVWVGARVAPLHEHELPVVQELPRPREVHHESEVRHQLALLPRNRLMVRHLDRAGPVFLGFFGLIDPRGEF